MPSTNLQKSNSFTLDCDDTNPAPYRMSPSSRADSTVLYLPFPLDRWFDDLQESFNFGAWQLDSYQPRNNGLLTAPQFLFCDDSNNYMAPPIRPIIMQAPLLPQPAIQPIFQARNSFIDVQDSQLFNNMPGFLIGGVQSLVNQLKYDGIDNQDLQAISTVSNCFDQLIKDVLMQISSKNGNRTQLRMVFNNVDDTLGKQIRDKKNKSKAQKSYFSLLSKYGQDTLNFVIAALRQGLIGSMTSKWMHYHAQKRQFKTQVVLKKQVFQKYLINFKQSLQNGFVPHNVNKQDVIQVQLFHQQ